MIYYYDVMDKFIFYIQINEYFVIRVMGFVWVVYVFCLMLFIYFFLSDLGDKFDIIFIFIFFFKRKILVVR